MEHLTITEVPTVPASEIRLGQELRTGAKVECIERAFGGNTIKLILNNGDAPIYHATDLVPVADIPVTVTGTIDITPAGMSTPEGCKRVQEAQQEWDMATHALANSVQAVIDELMDRDTDKITRAELYSQLQTLIGIRGVKQEAFLRAVAGK